MKYTSYETSKRLHDKGFKAEHKQAWISHSVDIHVCYPLERLCDCNTCKKNGRVNNIPAYTYTELWAALPSAIGKYFIKQDKGLHGRTCIWYDYDNKRLNASYQTNQSPTECAGLMVEWLIANGYMKTDDNGS